VSVTLSLLQEMPGEDSMSQAATLATSGVADHP